MEKSFKMQQSTMPKILDFIQQKIPTQYVCPILIFQLIGNWDWIQREQCDAFNFSYCQLRILRTHDLGQRLTFLKSFVLWTLTAIPLLLNPIVFSRRSKFFSKRTLHLQSTFDQVCTNWGGQRNQVLWEFLALSSQTTTFFLLRN